MSYLEQAWPQLPLVLPSLCICFCQGMLYPRVASPDIKTVGATESWAFSLKSIEVDESFFLYKVPRLEYFVIAMGNGLIEQ